MGAHICQFGVTHKMCRCRDIHRVTCDKPTEHDPKKQVDEHVCLVLEMKLDGRIPMGKHEAHPPHVWWYTSWGGGHQLNEISDPANDRDETEGYVKRWYCRGRDNAQH